MSVCSAGCRWLTLTLVAALLACGGGCELFGALAKVADGGNKVAAKYRLDNVDTLVLFDDPGALLGDPGLARQAAATAVHYLEYKKVLRKDAAFVQPAAVSRLEQRLGAAWPATPVDAIGRRLGAGQVVYARLIDADSLVAGNMYRPTARVEVKVLSADGGRRLWPNPGALAGGAGSSPGYVLTLEMDYQTDDRNTLRGQTPDALARQLADEIGLSLSRLFYNWAEEDAGASL